MKTLRYALLSTIVIAGTSSAQWANPRPAMYQLAPASQQDLQPTLLPAENDDQRAGGDIVWSEDFANGLAGNNGVGPWTTSGPGGAIWRRKTTGPLGAYTTTAQRITSTSVANGYMLFNGDSANCTWAGNTPTALPAAEFVSWDGSLESPVIDLSATPFVEIQFQQRLRYCCGTAPNFLDISTDGGTTWTTTYSTAVSSAGAAIVGNADPGTQTLKFNITNAISADPSNVKFRFHHDSNAGTSHYHWQIDDVKIVELYQYDLRMSGAATTAWDAASATSYDSLRYSIYPYSQLRPLGLNLSVLNNGSDPQDDVVANFKVERQGGAVVLDQDQAQPALAPGETTRVFVNPSFTPPADAGQYNVTYTVSSGQTDQTPTDNSSTGSFRVAQYTYARDNGTVASTQAAGTSTLIMANAFYVLNPVELTSISVALGTGSEIGSLVVGELRADNLDDVLATTDEKIVAANMLNPTGGSNFINLIFNPPVELEPGIDYMAAVQVYGDVRVGQSGTSEEQTSFIYFEGQAGLDWYFTTTTPMVRMNFDPTVGIDEFDASNTLGLGQNMPNPANGTTTIPYEVKDGGAVSFELRDVTGKLVMEQFLGNRAPGVYRMDIATDNLGEGVYFYSMTMGDARATKRMTVVR
jgi:hypothetical protein